MTFDSLMITMVPPISKPKTPKFAYTEHTFVFRISPKISNLYFRTKHQPLTLVMEPHSFLCEIRTECTYMVWISFSLRRGNNVGGIFPNCTNPRVRIVTGS